MNRNILNMTAAAALLLLSCAGVSQRGTAGGADLESELAVLKKRISMVEKRNALLEAENSDQRESLRQLRNDHAVLKAQSDARIRDLTEMNARLKAEYMETAGRLNGVIAGHEKKIAGLNDDIIKKDSSIKELQDHADRLKAESAGKDISIKELRELADRLKAESAGKDGDIAACQKKAVELAAEAEKLKTLVEKNETALKERDAAIGRLKAEIDALNSSLKDKASETKELKSKLDSLEAKKADQK